MIDVHHHCLPDVDDGPHDWSEAVDLCAMAAEEGVETIIATPHVLRGRWENTSRPELEERIAELRERTNGKPRLLLGSEYFFAHDVDEVLRAGNAIVPLAGSRYVLIELAANNVPPMIEGPLYRMQLDGWRPVLAHPERNTVFQQKPELLASLIQAGVRTQVTAGSLTGAFGSAARRAAEAWILQGMVHFVATDAHNTTRRPPRAKEGRNALEELAGERVARALVSDNPLAVVENRPLPYEPEPQPAPPKGFFQRMSRFFGGQ